MKTSTIRINNIKSSDGWRELAQNVAFDKFEKENPDLDEDELYNLFYKKVVNKYFEYGEYANIEIEVDENFNIVGGKIYKRN